MEKKIIFNTIKSQRAGLGLSVDDLAKKCGVSRQTIYNWEKGTATPDLKHINPLSEILQTDVGILVTYFTNRS